MCMPCPCVINLPLTHFLLGMVQSAGVGGQCPGLSIGDWSVWGNHAGESRGEQGRGVVYREGPCLLFDKRVMDDYKQEIYI